MATFTSDDLTEMRQALFKYKGSMGTGKPTINAALQAVEDHAVSMTTKAAFASAMDTATAPHVFSPEEKDAIYKVWLHHKGKIWQP